MGFGVIDTIMTGHASPQDLAAMALGAAIYTTVFVGLMGVIMALNPVIAHHFGGKRDAEIGKSWFQGVWLSVWLTFVGIAVLSFPDAWLFMSKVEPDVGLRVGGYLSALAFALPAALLFRTMYAFNTAVSRPKLVMMINLIGLACKLPLNYVLIYGKFGLPALGATGCGVATAIVMWGSCLIGYAVMRRDPFYERFMLRFDWPRWPAQKELLRLGVPMGLAYMIEVTSFTFMALLVARLGTQMVGGHQIASNVAVFCYMVPLALSIATSTLTAQALGAGDRALARRTTLTGLRLALLTSGTLAAFIWGASDWIVHAYTSDAIVAGVALSLIPYLACFHVFDALQCVASFSLRAYKRAVVPLITYVLALWGIGLGGGYWVAFHPVINDQALGARGLWLGSTISLAFAAAVLLTWFAIISRQKSEPGVGSTT